MCLAFASWTAGPGGHKAAWGLFPQQAEGTQSIQFLLYRGLRGHC